MSALAVGQEESKDPPVPVSRLERLFTAIHAATQNEDLTEALRLADAARRLAPDDPTTLIVQARILLDRGAHAEALALVDSVDDPRTRTVRAEALCRLSRYEEARTQCLELIASHAIDSVEGLSRVMSLIWLKDPQHFAGWVALDSTLSMVGIAPAGSHVRWKQGDQEGHYQVPLEVPEGKMGIQQPLNRAIHAPIEVSCSAGPLLGSPLACPPGFACSGWVVHDDSELVGELTNAWAPGQPSTLILGTRLGEIQRLVLPQSVAGGSARSFAIPFPKNLDEPLEVSMLLPDGAALPLLGSPLKHSSREARPCAMALALRSVPRDKLALGLRAHCIDIVVPVYAGYEETLRCIESVLATVARDQAELIVVNDASPEPRLVAALDRLAKSGAITLLSNRTNRGFSASVNRAIPLHPDRDVVLLNADCEVYDDWLSRLRAAAYSSHDISTVTPLGEQASIATYPAPWSRSEDSPNPSTLDAIAREVNAQRVVDVPVGVGFCMYLRRACLDETGRFDEDHFGRGYGEENDYCLRARHRGWRHVVAADVYVRHVGGRSFGSEQQVLRARHGRVLNALHPGYDELVAKHSATDPLGPVRRAIDLERLRRAAKNPVLLVTHAVGGGVERFVGARTAELAADGHSVITLAPEFDSPGWVRVELHEMRLENLRFAIPGDAPVLNSMLRGLNLGRIELHHFLDLPTTVLEEVVRLGAPYWIYLHDHSWMCPRLTLLGGDGRYCGEPEIHACESCIQTHGSALEPGLSVAHLRARSNRIMAGAEEVYCATDDVRLRFKHHFPLRPVAVIPWQGSCSLPRRDPPPSDGLIRVAVIGAINAQKGHQVILDCAREAAGSNLPLEFILIGFSSDDEALLETGKVFITGRYEESEIGALLARERCQVALFASVTPETWCWTLSYALSDGMPIVAFDIGAIGERLRGHGQTRLLPLSSSPGEINQSLLQIVKTTSSKVTSDFVGIGQLPELSSGESDTDPSIGDRQVGRGGELEGSPASAETSASVQMLTLPAGVYAFSIQSGAQSGGYRDEMTMPALHIGLAPVEPLAQVDFFAARGTLDRWLAFSDDRVFARISGDRAGVLLTSLRRAQDPALSIDVRRIDVPLATNPEGTASIQVMAHVRQLGDLFFPAESVGSLGAELWIEAFVVTGIDSGSPSLLEYRGITSDGFETPWLTDSVLCGSRGRGTPLLGFAVRPRVAFARTRVCTYWGHFSSGRRIGPLSDGSLCRSDLPDDPLEGIELRVTTRG